MPERTTFAEWVILELLGHRRLAGYLTEAQIAGASFLRIARGGVPAPVQRWELPAVEPPDHDENPYEDEGPF